MTISGEDITNDNHDVFYRTKTRIVYPRQRYKDGLYQMNACHVATLHFQKTV
jgi:hypothetical protein